MNKVAAWFDRNRKTIGYTAGGLNVLAGLTLLLNSGGIGLVVVWFVIGASILWDTWKYK